MTEIVVNSIQMVCTAICSILCARRIKETKDHSWIMLGLSSSVFFLGDLYWQLYMLFYGESPHYSYIPYVGWYACYLFLIFMLIEIRGKCSFRSGKKILWIVPLFTASMGLFFLQWGDVFGNIISFVFMTVLIWLSAEGLLLIQEGSQDRRENKFLYLTILLFCILEYAAWTASCFWSGDTIHSAYYWFDALLSVTFLLFPRALEKAVRV